MAKKSMKLGGGGRFAKMVKGIEKSGKSAGAAKAIAAAAGRKKYGAKKMASMAKKGKARAEKGKKHKKGMISKASNLSRG